jgi:FMN phosphatase YigB (HAD superfamily)
VLVDVGGTLWPDRWPARPADRIGRRYRLRAAFPGLSPGDALAVLTALEQAGVGLDGQVAQDSGTYVGGTLRRFGLGDGPGQIAAAIDAMCVPAGLRIRLFPGARELLACIRDLGLKSVIVSNAVWRDAAAYRRDFEVFGIAGLLDAVVSSVDAGVRKPHCGMFVMAAAAAGVPLDACIVIGNSEDLDIRPARSLGIRTLRVAIEEPPPCASAADHVVRSLSEAADVLGEWCGRGPA